MGLKNPRLKPTMTMTELISVMSSGDMGAGSVLLKVMADAPQVDPDSAFPNGIGTIINLDCYNIYDTDIWILYKFICNKRTDVFIAMVRAVQLGIVDEATLHQAIYGARAGQGAATKVNEIGITIAFIQLDVEDVIRRVKLQLPRFVLDLPLPK